MLKRPVTTQLEEEGRLAVNEIVNRMNCQYRRHEPDNAGIDGEIELVENGVLTGKFLKCQVKAGRSYISSENRTIKVKVEKKYLEQWSQMSLPVILFFYHPEIKQVFWKSIKDYLRGAPDLLRQQKDTILIPFDKETDLFSPESFHNLMSVAKGEFDYQKPIYSEESGELILSNWFPVLEFPKFVYKAPTKFPAKAEITKNLTGYYSFIFKEGAIYSFSDLRDRERELSTMCDPENVSVLNTKEMPSEKYFIELLNSVLYITAVQNDLEPEGERFYFSPKVLSNNTKSKFELVTLAGKKDSRKKIYIYGLSRSVEYKHLAVKLKFQQLGSDWFLEIEPDFYFTYPNRRYSSRKEVGIRIIKEKANLYNKEYLYLLHFWKQFLSKNSDRIILFCDNASNAQEVVIGTNNLSTISDFMLLNDYEGPTNLRGV